MQQLARCNFGHYFDQTKHSSCPHCGINIDFDMQPTMPKRPEADADMARTTPLAAAGPVKSAADEGRTVGMYQKKIGVDPVVGWLVCIEGVNKGQDYRLHSEKNFIGRSESMDVALKGDDSVSRENHAIVSYNLKNHTFRVYPGEGRGIVYLNDDEVVTGMELKAYDILEVGSTKLMFIPFCGDTFKWS